MLERMFRKRCYYSWEPFKTFHSIHLLKPFIFRLKEKWDVYIRSWWFSLWPFFFLICSHFTQNIRKIHVSENSNLFFSFFLHIHALRRKTEKSVQTLLKAEHKLLITTLIHYQNKSQSSWHLWEQRGNWKLEKKKN